MDGDDVTRMNFYSTKKEQQHIKIAKLPFMLLMDYHTKKMLHFLSISDT